MDSHDVVSGVKPTTVIPADRTACRCEFRANPRGGIPTDLWRDVWIDRLVAILDLLNDRAFLFCDFFRREDRAITKARIARFWGQGRV